MLYRLGQMYFCVERTRGAEYILFLRPSTDLTAPILDTGPEHSGTVDCVCPSHLQEFRSVVYRFLRENNIHVQPPNYHNLVIYWCIIEDGSEVPSILAVDQGGLAQGGLADDPA